MGKMSSPLFICFHSLFLSAVLFHADVRAQCGFGQSNVGSSSCYDPCSPGNYQHLINETHRTAAVMVYNTSGGDALLPRNTWFRVTSPSGNDMYTSCPTIGHCGTVFTWWLNGNLPVPADGIVSRNAGQNGFSGCTTNSVTIQIRDCGSYRVYQIPPTVGQGQGYCFGNEQPCSSGLTSANGWTPGCVPVTFATTPTTTTTTTTTTSPVTSPTAASSGGGASSPSATSSGGGRVRVNVASGLEMSTILMIILPTSGVLLLLLITLLAVFCNRHNRVKKIDPMNSGDVPTAPYSRFKRPNPLLNGTAQPPNAAAAAHGTSQYPEDDGDGEEDFSCRTPPPSYRPRDHNLKFHPPPEFKPRLLTQRDREKPKLPKAVW